MRHSCTAFVALALACGDGSGGNGTGNTSPTASGPSGSESVSDSAGTEPEPTEGSGNEASQSESESDDSSDNESSDTSGPPCDGPPGSCGCADGPVTGSCICGDNEVDGGWCCGGVLQEGDCGGDPALAFPGVEGFGAYTTGGRGGQVIKVTTLDATGPGSLDEALRTEGPRIVVFDVSGVINGDFEIAAGDVTIAGETAPGAGITIVGRLWAPFTNPDESCTSRCGTSTVANIIVRHVRVRHVCRAGQPDNQCDAMRFSSQSRFVLDHMSVAWGIDESLDMWGGAYDWTIQNTTFEHPCRGTTDAGPDTGSPDHAYGILNRRGGYGSMLRTAMLSCRDRNPAFADGPFDIINTVVYNHQTGITHHNPPSGDFSIIGNYYKWGPAGGVGKPFWLSDSTAPMFWFEDSIIEDGSGQLAFDDPWTTAHPLLGSEQMGNVPDSQRAPARPDYSVHEGWVAPNVLAAADAFTVVLDTAGAFPRDVVTSTAIDEARTSAGEFGCSIRTQLDGDGNPAGPEHPLMDGLEAGDAPADADGDGLPDAWESGHDLDPNDASDNHTLVESTGYDAIESYLHERAALLLWGG